MRLLKVLEVEEATVLSLMTSGVSLRTAQRQRRSGAEPGSAPASAANISVVDPRDRRICRAAAGRGAMSFGILGLTLLADVGDLIDEGLREGVCDDQACPA